MGITTEKKKKFTIKLNNEDKIEQLLQETYDLACQQYYTIQNEINKIVNTTILKDLDIEGKEKYAKTINNYMTLQQKAIGQKFDIAKLMAEVVKQNGDVKGALDSAKKAGATSIDFKALRKLANEANTVSSEESPQEYKLKNHE